MAFSEDETAYLYSASLGRLATVDSDGQPDVVPVTVEFDGRSTRRVSASAAARSATSM